MLVLAQTSPPFDSAKLHIGSMYLAGHKYEAPTITTDTLKITLSSYAHATKPWAKITKANVIMPKEEVSSGSLFLALNTARASVGGGNTAAKIAAMADFMMSGGVVVGGDPHALLRTAMNLPAVSAPTEDELKTLIAAREAKDKLDEACKETSCVRNQDLFYDLT